jgi:flagellum-specific peptidoglycan hydrolase FlgJ
MASKIQGITRDQVEFLNHTIKYCQLISEWSVDKASTFGKKIYTIYPEVVLAHIIIESNWGNHPLSQPSFGKRGGNNLALLEPDHLFQGKYLNEFEGRKYKSYESWGDFATDYSDSLAFNGYLNPISKQKDKESQISALASLKSNPIVYKAKLEAVIQTFDLSSLFN